MKKLEARKVRSFSGTVKDRDVFVELTGTYSRRVPEKGIALRASHGEAVLQAFQFRGRLAGRYLFPGHARKYVPVGLDERHPWRSTVLEKGLTLRASDNRTVLNE